MSGYSSSQSQSQKSETLTDYCGDLPQTWVQYSAYLLSLGYVLYQDTAPSQGCCVYWASLTMMYGRFYPPQKLSGCSGGHGSNVLQREDSNSLPACVKPSAPVQWFYWEEPVWFYSKSCFFLPTVGYRLYLPTRVTAVRLCILLMDSVLLMF